MSFLVAPSAACLIINTDVSAGEYQKQKLSGCNQITIGKGCDSIGAEAWSKCPEAKCRLPRLLRTRLLTRAPSGGAGPLGTQSLPQVLKLAASKAADFPRL